MKTITSVLALAAIAYIIFLSGSLFLQGDTVSSCMLIILWIGSLIVWVKYAAPLVKGAIVAKNIKG